MAQAVRAAQQAGGTNAVARTARNMRGAAQAGLFDVFLEHYTASILSGMKTMAINATSGAMNTFVQPFARMLGAAADLNAAEMRSSLKLMVNTVGSAFDVVRYGFLAQGNGSAGMKSVWRTFMDEQNHLLGDGAIPSRRATTAKTFGQSDTSLVGKTINAYGKNLVRIPFRVNQSIEEFFTNVGYLAHIRTKAAEAAEQAVLANTGIPATMKHQAYVAYVDAYVKDAFEFSGQAKRDSAGKLMHEDAARYAKSINFAQDLEYGFGQSLMGMVEKHPFMRLIVPFIKAPTNMIRTAIRMTPGIGQIQEAYVRRLVRDGVIQRTGEEALRAKGEMIMGASVWTVAAYMAANGNITGGGPVNKQERAVLQATGWRPYSLLTTGPDGTQQYIEFRRFDPMSTILGLAADFSEVGAYLNDGDSKDFAVAAMLSVSNNLSSKTYLTGLSETLKALTQPDVYGSKFLQNRASAVVPNFFAKYAEAGDDSMREARSILDAIKRRIPGMSNELAPRRNVLGEVVTPTPGFLPFVDTQRPGLANQFSRMASPANASRLVNDDVKLEMARLRVAFSPPSAKMDGIDLTTIEKGGRDAYDRYQELTGTVTIGDKTLAQRLSAVIGSERYQSQPAPADPGDLKNPRVQIITSVINQHRAKAKRQMLTEYPELLQARRQLLLASRTGASRYAILDQLQD